MLDAEIRIVNIDYENTLCNIFPMLSEKISSRDSKNLIIRLLQQLGDAAVPVLKDLLLRLPGDTKNELLISAVNAYSHDLTKKVNNELHKDKWGRFFCIGNISPVMQKNIILAVGGIKVDYRGLLKSDEISEKVDDKLGVLSRPVRSIVNMAAFAAPDALEKMGLELLLQNENKERLMKLLRDVITRYGIAVEFDEISIRQVISAHDTVTEEHRTFSMSEKTENDIISALAGYLRDNMHC